VATQKIHYRLEHKVAVLRMDDGKANSIEGTFLRELQAGLDRAAQEAQAVVIEGRAGFFSAGLDLKVLPTLAPAELQHFLGDFVRSMFRVWLHPAPVVAAVTGHMMAGGAILALCCDRRWGAEGSYRVGMNEVAIGIPMPLFAWELAAQALTPSARNEALLFGEVYDPVRAVSVGFLDRLLPADQVSTAALAEAQRLAALPAGALAQTKRNIRGPQAAEVERYIDGMVAALFTGGPLAKG